MELGRAVDDKEDMSHNANDDNDGKADKEIAKGSKIQAAVKSLIKDSFPIRMIGVGASAGGLEALQEFLSGFPPVMKGVAIIIAQHLSPTYKSMLVELLGRGTKMPVIEIKNGQILKENCVYITPPDSELSLKNMRFVLNKPKLPLGPKPSIDIFFTSMAQEYKHNAIAVILSGTGSDGAQGIKAVKNAGGFTLAQDPATAKYDGMPQAAIHTGMVDMVLAPEEMGEEIQSFILHPEHLSVTKSESVPADAVQKLFKLLSESTGTNFLNYKEPTIFRRLEKRMSILKYENLEDYVDFAASNPKELDSLYHTILIGVTSFFRDVQAFKILELELIKLINTKKTGDKIRIWVPGCASGEEPYTIAIILADILRKRLNDFHIQIFATDINERAISYGRKAQYPATALKNLPDSLIATYFIQRGNYYEVVDTIRQMVLFSRHDISVNPPFLKIDLISCRNLLIYFGNNLQKYVIPIFHYSLNQNAYLLLGKSESIGSFSDLFSVVDNKHKLYQRKQGNNKKVIHFGSLRTERGNQKREIESYPAELSLAEKLKLTIFNTFEHPYVIINDTMSIVEVYGDVRNFLTIQPGAMDPNIFKMVVKELQLDLRMVINNALKEHGMFRSPLRRLKALTSNTYVRLCCRPLLYSDPGSEYYMLIFETLELEDGMAMAFRSEDNCETPQILELKEELAITKEHLQTYIEELETANEELQSLNEELQSSNEELQSVNEELETANEELQSTNEEVQVAYGELKELNKALRQKEKELSFSEMNARVLLDNTLQAFVLLDVNYQIVTFNDTALKHFKLYCQKPIQKAKVIIDFLPADDVQEFCDHFRKAMMGENVSCEKCSTDNMGVSRYYTQHFTPVRDESGGTIYVSLGFIDVTIEKYAMQAMQKAKEKAEEMNRLKANFLANMSHELRTPMVGILGYSNLLLESITDKTTRNLADTIQNSSMRLLHTLNQILDISKLESGNEDVYQEPIDIIAKTKETLHLFEVPAAKKALAIEFTHNEDQLICSLDPRLFGSVLDNLINNAIKFTSQGKVLVSAENSDNSVRITVKDSGIGISEADIKVIFDPFRQASEGYSRSYEGTGLGLSISKKYVELMGGTISVSSSSGIGSTFEISFPYDPTLRLEPREPKPEVKTLDIRYPEKIRVPSVLLVDDDEMILKLLTAMFKDKLVLEHVFSYDKAIEKLHANVYDVLLIDINLKSNKSGMDILQEIRKIDTYQNKPVVALTAYAMLGDKERFLESGFSHYVAKPFTRIEVGKILFGVDYK